MPRLLLAIVLLVLVASVTEASQLARGNTVSVFKRFREVDIDSLPTAVSTVTGQRLPSLILRVIEDKETHACFVTAEGGTGSIGISQAPAEMCAKK